MGGRREPGLLVPIPNTGFRMGNNSKWQGLATSKSWNKLAHLCRTWARAISIPPYRVGTGVPENGFSVFLKALLSYGDKETIRIFPRCSCIWWEARKFVSFSLFFF